MAARKVVIFDFDGTLADTGPLIKSIYNQMAKQNNWRPMTDKDYAYLRRSSVREAKKWTGMHFWQFPIIVRSAKRLMRLEADKVQLFPGVFELIKELEAKNIEMYVLSRNMPETIAHVLQRVGLKDALPILHARRWVFENKATALKQIIRKKGYKHENVWMVGDEVRDVEAAKKVGINSIAVSWGLQDESVLGQHRPDFLVRTVDELGELLRS